AGEPVDAIDPVLLPRHRRLDHRPRAYVGAFLHGRELPRGGRLGAMTAIEPHKRRLKGLDEFAKPAFVGRMGRIERRRRLAWWAMLAGGVAVGSAIGLVLF